MVTNMNARISLSANISKSTDLKTLNATLGPQHDLSGAFLPTGSIENFDVMFVAEMPSMNEPKEQIDGRIPNFASTARDRFLHEMMVKYGVAGSYVTDIVKTRDIPRRPKPDEVKKWLPFLLKEINIIRPKAIVVIGKRTHESFERFVKQYLPEDIKVYWVFHYSNQVPRKKFEDRFREVLKETRATMGICVPNRSEKQLPPTGGHQC
jgi:uracil-DNA glycosylase family 4